MAIQEAFVVLNNRQLMISISHRSSNDAPVNFGRKHIASGSWQKNNGATTLWTTGGGNPLLLAFPDQVEAGYGARNDDNPNGGTESRLTGLTSNVVYWVVPMVYPSTSDRETGITAINY
jgi:hypothetical protein